MKNNIKEINFGEGIGELKFGMTKDQVSSLLGKPDEIENIPGIDEEVNDDLVSWHYDNLEISLVFDRLYDWKLVSISGSDAFYTLHGRSVVGIPLDEFEDFFENLGIEITNSEDLSDEDNPNFYLIESEDIGLLVWFDEGEAVEFQILPDVAEDGETIMWPN
ncbi:MAG: hypothetical protein IPL63_08125 [Saprospiraceae bacterium]|nr:hypothetical protein [Saprospiraceae bacterium]MBK6564293.1 hypothetical protein [Saprospiraceae bacterium]MBK7524022.1 hypothetical protein [Saprospiraceae bacterium]MBK8079006.1 hypothetical protein [Saprospiraceae bacterium]MBK8372078.1 hypothetical protein [Saprospiraceae bacterium]